MKNLILFCPRFSYTLHHATPVAENGATQGENEMFESVLAVFCAAEAHDTSDITTEVAKDLRKMARKNGTQKIVVNPFAHLSSRLAAPADAIRLIDEVVGKINKEEGFEAVRLHFGWYKAFHMSVSGEENTQTFREY